MARSDNPARHRPPRDAVVAVTSRCNAHCVMCNVWQHPQADALAPEHMAKLPPSLASVNLSGGEPFLRDDLEQFVLQVRRRCRRARITISTNGYLADRIADRVESMVRIDPRLRLAVSLDGLGAAHDTVRGDAGAYERVIRLLDLLQGRGYRGLRLSMTIGAANADQLPAVAELARTRGLELGVVAAHRCRTHMRMDRQPAGPSGQRVRAGFQRVLLQWLRSWQPRHWLRAHFAAGTYRHLAGTPQPLICGAGGDFFFLQADGTVYSCGSEGRVMGNLVSHEWDELWNSPAAGQARAQSGGCGRNCWMVCTVRTWYRRNLPAVAAWVVRSKLLAHLRLFRLGEGRSEASGAARAQVGGDQASIEAPVRADPSH